MFLNFHEKGQIIFSVYSSVCTKKLVTIKVRNNSILAVSRDEVQLFLEGHENVRNRPDGFDIYLVNFKTMGRIAQIFLVFPEKLNFNY